MVTQYSSGYPTWGRTRNRGQDWAILILAIWLFISPWVLQFGSGQQAGTAASLVEVSRAAWNAWVLGVIVFLVALSGVGRMDVRQEWIALVLGAWIFVAPWVLGFTALPKASWDHWIDGALIFLIALWTLSAARTIPIRTAAAPPLASPPLGNPTAPTSIDRPLPGKPVS